MEDLLGSYTCVCDAGYTLTSNDTHEFVCENINECDLGTDSCHDNATCTDTIGNYTCSCKTGFSGDGYDCSDVNECDLGRTLISYYNNKLTFLAVRGR